MSSYPCPTCSGNYVDILDHIRKKHPQDAYTAIQLQPLGLTPCPTCATACKGEHGIRTHSAKIHGETGSSRVSTLPRNRTQLPPPPRAATFSPMLPNAPTLPQATNNGLGASRWATTQPTSPLSTQRKRTANTPSPRTQRTATRQKITHIAIEDTSEDEASSDSESLPSLSTLIAESIPRRQETAPSSEQPSLKEEHARTIAPILEKTSIQALLAYSKVNIPEKKLHARQAVLFQAAAERTAEAFLRHPREKALLHFLLLPRVLGQALHKGQLPATMRAYPTTIPPLEEQAAPVNSASTQTPAERATKLLEKGYLGRASRALIDYAPLAAESEEMLDALYKKHPIGQQNPFNGSNPAPGQSISLEAISTAISSINKEKAPGLSGWTRPLLDIATGSLNSPVIAALRLLTDMIRQGTAPGQELLCASRLIGLEKKDGGVRPIAAGDLIYKVALKAILTTTFRTNMLLPAQLGVNSKGGVEPAVFLLEEAITGPNKQQYKKIASLDLSNAFNSVGRTAIATAVAKYAPTFYRTAKWAYNQPSILVTHDGAILASAEGVRQGDPLGPLLFSLALRPTLEHLQRALPTATLVAYLDDIYILGKDNTNLIRTAATAFKGTPIKLNPTKSFEKDISTLQKDGLTTLGTHIGPLETRKTFLMQKTSTLASALDAIRDLPKQHAFLLLRGSIHLLLRHLLRQLDPSGLGILWEYADTLITSTVLRLATRETNSHPKDLHKGLITLPVREGGLGIPSHARLAVKLYKAAKHAGKPLLELISPGTFTEFELVSTVLSAKEVLAEENSAQLQAVTEKLSISQQKARIENASYLGRRWLQILPTQKQHLIADPNTTEAIRTRLLAPVRPTETPCSYCGSNPSIGHEDVCKGASRRWISRHNQVTRAFINTLSCRNDLKVEEEPIVGEIRPNDPNPLRTDFSVLLGTSRYYYDVQIVAVNKDSAREDAYSTLTEAASEKKRKYSSLGAFFHPLIFSAGGLMEKATAQAYKGLQKLLGPQKAAWLDTTIALALTQARAQAATSIARNNPRTHRNN